MPVAFTPKASPNALSRGRRCPAGTTREEASASPRSPGPRHRAKPGFHSLIHGVLGDDRITSPN
eukprot:1386716-Pyramimonas_sp.AAC.2